MRPLIRRLSEEDRLWGARRIRGVLRKPGIAAGNESIRRYRWKRPPRPPRQTWRTSLCNHAAQIWAADRFAVPTVPFRTLSVVFFVTYDRRQLVHLRVTALERLRPPGGDKFPGSTGCAEWSGRDACRFRPWLSLPDSPDGGTTGVGPPGVRASVAIRPVFVPTPGLPRVRTLDVDFEWSPGFALSQQQKSIASLHRAALRHGVRRPLEISSKSPEELGRSLSAFNLRVEHPAHGLVPLESAFQAAKRFSRGGPFAELALATPRDARGDPRLRNSGLLLGFQWGDRRLPNLPPHRLLRLALPAGARPAWTRRCGAQIRERDGFTDIAFNPEKSLNCQARSAALYVALARDGVAAPWALDFLSSPPPHTRPPRKGWARRGAARWGASKGAGSPRPARMHRTAPSRASRRCCS